MIPFEGMEMASIGDARLEAAHFVGELIRYKPDLPWAGEESGDRRA